jgi:hypothetical protein
MTPDPIALAAIKAGFGKQVCVVASLADQDTASCRQWSSGILGAKSEFNTVLDLKASMPRFDFRGRCVSEAEVLGCCLPQVFVSVVATSVPIKARMRLRRAARDARRGRFDALGAPLRPRRAYSAATLPAAALYQSSD